MAKQQGQAQEKDCFKKSDLDLIAGIFRAFKPEGLNMESCIKLAKSQQRILTLLAQHAQPDADGAEGREKKQDEVAAESAKENPGQ